MSTVRFGDRGQPKRSWDWEQPKRYARQLSQGVGIKDHSYSRSKRFKKSCMGWTVGHFESPWSSPSKLRVIA